jgi:Zn-dependent protease
MQGTDIIHIFFALGVLIMSVIMHEVSHGYAASALGDQTARYAGRLTLNPKRHFDFMGSFVVPVVSFLFAGFAFGWAKPVPYNPYNLKNQKWGPAIVALAGPLSNIAIAVFFGLIIRFMPFFVFFPPIFYELLSFVVVINILLAVFNLMPVPPLDGSKVLLAFLPYHWQKYFHAFEQYGLVLVVIVVYLLWGFIVPIVPFFFSLITGRPV